MFPLFYLAKKEIVAPPKYYKMLLIISKEILLTFLASNAKISALYPKSELATTEPGLVAGGSLIKCTFRIRLVANNGFSCVADGLIRAKMMG